MATVQMHCGDNRHRHITGISMHRKVRKKSKRLKRFNCRFPSINVQNEFYPRVYYRWHRPNNTDEYSFKTIVDTG